MPLIKVTLTGADDTIDPAELFKLSAIYPFVEWGILFSDNRKNSERYPSPEWIADLVNLRRSSPTVQFSAHLCGPYNKVFFKGGVGDLYGQFTVADFNRVQVNYRFNDILVNPYQLIRYLVQNQKRNFILQWDEHKDVIYHMLALKCKNVLPLFDISGGKGIVPMKWKSPKLINCSAIGYAGGLSYENLHENLEQIKRDACGHPFWIDMESSLRKKGSRKKPSWQDHFDLEKCLAVLDFCEDMVAK